MEEIIEDYEQGGREESGYVVIDVRGKLLESNIEHCTWNISEAF